MYVQECYQYSFCAINQDFNINRDHSDLKILTRQILSSNFQLETIHWTDDIHVRHRHMLKKNQNMNKNKFKHE